MHEETFGGEAPLWSTTVRCTLTRKQPRDDNHEECALRGNGLGDSSRVGWGPLEQKHERPLRPDYTREGAATEWCANPCC